MKIRSPQGTEARVFGKSRPGFAKEPAFQPVQCGAPTVIWVSTLLHNRGYGK